MIYLILAVICSVLVSVIMRVSGKYVRNDISMLACNYLMCTVLAAICTGTWNLLPINADRFSFSLGLGGVSGILYLSSFILLQWNVRKNGVILSSMFMKLGVMVPTLMAIFIFREVPQLSQVIGLVIALGAILLINLEKGSGKAASGIGLVLLLLTGGGTDATSKVYEELGAAPLKNHFLLYTFFAAFLLCLAVCLVKKQKLRGSDLGFGLLIGIPNYCSARFLLLSLADVPAVIAYPTYSVASIVLVTLAGVALFREKLSRRQMLSMALIFAALILLNV
ncbi:MAG: EamA family transporter [Clostridia bacterium]|nr:EamA family transporter [Clostridia bacterium]